MRSAQSPFRPMQSKPGQTLKPSMGWGSMNEELQAAATLARVTGGIIPARDEYYSAVVSAMAENEAILTRARARENLHNRQASQKQASFDSRQQQPRKDWFEAQCAAWDHRFDAGSTINAALDRISREYPTRRAKKPNNAPVPARTIQSAPRATATATAAPKRETITRAANGHVSRSYQKTVHFCDHEGCNEEARMGYREGNLPLFWLCDKHKY